VTRLLLILTTLLNFSAAASQYSYTDHSYNIDRCFSDVEFKEYSPNRRNRGFDICLSKYPIHNFQLKCPLLADRYYGLAAKRAAMSQCFEKTTTFNSCLRVADNMPTYPLRTSSALKCIEKFSVQITQKDCDTVAFRYHPIRAKVKKLCDEILNTDDLDQNQSPAPSSGTIGDGSTQVIQF